jgi:2-haloalkanoic acid dehalogenase type II
MTDAVLGVTFDLDDTLWETGPVIARAEQSSIDWLGEHAPRTVAGKSPDDLMIDRRAFYLTLPHLSHDFTALRLAWFRRIMADAQLSASLADEAFEAFWRARNEVTPFPEAMAVVESLKSTLRLGTITNGNACVHHIGIGHHFDVVVTAEMAGAAKPHPQIFAYALEQMSLPAAQVVHIGDDPITDVAGARDFGMRTVWINPAAQPWNPEHGAPPDAIVGHVRDAQAFLERWSA